MNRNRMMGLALSMLLIASLACSFSGLKNKLTTVDITLTQDQVNSLFQNISVDTSSGSSADLITKVDHVEMHDGYIRVFGTATTQDGTETNGSFDVSIGAANDSLTAQIIRVDIPGVDLNDPRIVQANQQLQSSLTKAVNETNGKVLVKSAAVQNGVLKISVQLNIQ